MKKVLSNPWTPFLVSAGIFLFLQLQVFNLGLLFRDEGFLAFGAHRILNGEIPYRDFFLTTTPGSFYFQAFLFKVFGEYLILDRISYIISIVITLFFLSKIYPSSQLNKYIGLISTAVILVSPAALGFYNTEGFMLAIISFYFLTKSLTSKRMMSVFFAGLLMGLVFVFKQSYGGWLTCGLLLIVLMDRFKRYGLKDPFILMFLGGILSIIIPFVLYLYSNSALDKFSYYSIIFAGIVKSHRNQFVIKSLIGIPVLFLIIKVFSCNFLRKHLKVIALGVTSLFILSSLIVGLSYFESSRIYYGIFILLPLLVLVFMKGNQLPYKGIRYMSVFMLFYFLANAASGRSLGIVNITSPLFIPIAIEFVIYVNKRRKLLVPSLLYGVILALVILHVAYLSWGALSPNGNAAGIYPKKTLTDKIDVRVAAYLKVSKKTAKEIEFITSYIRKKYPEKKLLCFPYCPLMNILTKKESPSYFNFFYHEGILPENQNQVISELKNSNSIVIIQRKGEIEPEAEFEDLRLKKLIDYILKHYKKGLVTSNFIIFH